MAINIIKSTQPRWASKRHYTVDPRFFTAYYETVSYYYYDVGCWLYYCIVSVLFLLFVWPSMAINNVSARYNGGLLHDIILLAVGGLNK